MPRNCYKYCNGNNSQLNHAHCGANKLANSNCSQHDVGYICGGLGALSVNNCDCYDVTTLAGSDSVYFNGAVSDSTTDRHYGEFRELINSSSSYGGNYGSYLTTRFGGIGKLSGSYYFFTSGRYRITFLYNAQLLFEAGTSAFANVYNESYNVIGSIAVHNEVTSSSIYNSIDIDVNAGYILNFGVRSSSGIPALTHSRIDITAV